MSTTDLDETQAVRGMARAIADMRRKGVGWLEVLIGAAVLVVILSSFLTSYLLLRDELREAARERQARRDRARIAEIATNTQAGLDELRSAIAKGPAATQKAIEELIRRFEEIERQQTAIIIREQRSSRPVIIYVTPSPSPQPTATVTCNPTPIVSNRPCNRP